MKVFVIFLVLIVGVSGISSSYAFSNELLIFAGDEVRKIYYDGKNVTSAIFVPSTAGAIFETGYDATLEIKAPKVYKNGPDLFILKDGEEISTETTADGCFYYVTIETQKPSKIEILFTYWPEYPETVDNCETFTIAPLKQVELGISFNEIQCKQNLVLIQKYDDSPACVTESTKHKLIERGWVQEKIVIHYNEKDYLEEKVDLTAWGNPKDSQGRINYHGLLHIIAKQKYMKIFEENNIPMTFDDIFLTTGPSHSMYTEVGYACGYADTGKQVFWLESRLEKDTMTKLKIHDDNPMPCKPNHDSCFCNAQTHMLENTQTNLSYFDESTESTVAQIVHDYTTTDNKNLATKFKIGKYNIGYGEDVIGFCGEFWGHNTFDYFQGWIQNDSVIGFGIEKEQPKLCAISDNAQYFGTVLGELGNEN